MKISSKWIVLVSILTLSIVAGVPVAFANPSSDLANIGKPHAVEVNERLDWSITPKGEPGSGWRSDALVAGGSTSELDSSISSYVDPGTGAVTLYVAHVWWDSTDTRYEGRIARSFNQGATWSTWWTFWWGGHHLDSPSLVVNAYNNTLFVATERYPTAGGDHDIDVWRFAGGHWEVHGVDTDADDDRYPSLAIEYSYTTNWLYVSYEKYDSYNDRDLYFARSTNWGQTWTTTLLRSGTHVYTQSDITYAQGNIYIAYRHSPDYADPGHIDIVYSIDYGSTWNYVSYASGVDNDASWPSIAGSRAGAWHIPTTLWIAFENKTTDADILVSWSKDYGDSWSTSRVIAGTSEYERRPQLTVDGMGTQNTNVGGNFHLIYWTSEDTATRTNGIYYTQIPYNEPDWRPDPQVFGFTVPWTPRAQIIDNNGFVSGAYPVPTITTFTRTVGAETLWMPGVAWTDLRNPSYDIYFTTLDTMFNVTFHPSSQTVEVGKSLSYYVTVNLISGATATATLTLTGRIVSWSSRYIWKYTFSPSTVTPTDTSLLTFYTVNDMPAGSYTVNASAVIGGYRRFATIPFIATASPTLTLDISPSTVARGALLTISGQLSPAPGSPQTIYLYYRFPHQTGSWTLGTTMTTDAAGAYSITPTIPMSAPLGDIDLVAFWVNTNDGSYATSPIKVLTITP